MQITRQADYATRVALFLASLKPGDYASTAQIAREQKIPKAFLVRIVAQLAAADILHTRRGAQGGVALARPAHDLSLLEIVEVIDGPIVLNECVRDPGGCPLGERCTLQAVWCEAQAALVARLAQTKFGPPPSQPDSQDPPPGL